MFNFNKMPADARVWVYQSSRMLSPEEVDLVASASESFLNQWQAHGNDLRASFKVAYDRFLILTVDESAGQASGCSIDASVHLIKALEHLKNVSNESSFYESAIWYQALVYLRLGDEDNANSMLQEIINSSHHYKNEAARELLKNH